MASPPEFTGEIVLYRTEDGSSRIECRFADQNVWLTQALMAELFQTTPQNITLHLKSIYEEGELMEQSTCKEYLQVQTEGNRRVNRRLRYYNLEAILAVGYRVRSPQGLQFRQWATARLKEYLVKGFVLDDQRLKNPPGPGVPDYFDELLERIRDIRASERRIYTRVRDILALAEDYRSDDGETQVFYQTVQNKLHFAVTGKTAAELVAERAKSEKANMGLTSWKGAVVRKADVTVAKNYLEEGEISDLNRIVTMFLDYAEDQAKSRKQIFLKDWRERLDSFLRFNERAVLPDTGRISRDEANRRAEAEYEQFSQRRRESAEAEGLKELQSAAQRVQEQKKGPGRKRRR